jgi:DNA-binding XRE family transcriptional regulator
LSTPNAHHVAQIYLLIQNVRMNTRKQSINLPITNVERLATELRKLRRERKVSQQELSNRANVARRTITNAESAENVGIKEFSRIVNTLGYELVLRPQNSVVFEELSTTFKDDE